MIPTNTPPELQGVPASTLQAWLLASQLALNDMMIGKNVSEVSYSSGEGTKMVRYNRNNEASLRQYILSIQRALGIAPPRRALGVRFG